MRDFPRSASMRAHYGVDSVKGERLLPAIREPLWTNHEVEKFWLVLEPYMKRLTFENLDLPDPDVDFTELDRGKMSHFECCLLDVQELIWRGKYSLAVSNLRSIRSYFWKKSSEKFKIREGEGELSVLRTLFVRRMPRRKMLCQFKWNSI